MASVIEQLTKKIELSNIGKLYLVESNSAKDSTEVSIVDIEDPRHYKDIFKLDTLSIEKSLKSVLVEVKDSILRLYYVLDSSCFYIDFDCSYQVLEAIQELPIEAISYFRILFSKKAPLEIKVYSDILYVNFENSKEKGEKVGKKYVLELPLKSICELNAQVVELVEKVVSLERYSIGKDIVGLPLNYDSIKTLNTKESVEYWGNKVYSDYGDFIIVDTSGLSTITIICPTLISNNYLKEEVLSTSSDTKTTKELSNLILEDDIFEETFMESDSD